MNRLTKVIFFVMFLAFVVGCENKKDEYYARPEWLAGPIYQQLETEGRFGIFMALLEELDYDEILGKTGYFTVFAPNDSAFQAKGINSIADLDSQSIREIVQYSIIDNGYTPQQLAAYQANSGWEYGVSFRRRTRFTNKYYKTTLTERFQGNDIVFDAYIKNEGNKYIHYFLDEYFQTTGISPSTYSSFYPDVEYTGFNIVDARVLGDFIVAENGYIYELDKVIDPLPNYNEYFFDKPKDPDYSKFAQILERSAKYDSDTSQKWNGLPVYYKTFSENLPFDPASESSSTSNTPQKTCNTMFVPDNETLGKFLDEVLLKYFTLDDLENKRPEIIDGFLAAHMYNELIWPGQFAQKQASFNVLLDESNVKVKKVLSNGIFYGISEIIHRGNYFISVLKDVFLNPEYSNYYYAISKISTNTSLVNTLTSNSIDYTLFITKDPFFETEGYVYNPVDEEFMPAPSGNIEVTKMLNLSLVRGDYSDITGSGFLKSQGGDIIVYGNNKFWAGGNIETSAPSQILSSNKEPVNGTVYTMNKNLVPPTKTYMAILSAPPAGAGYAQFYDYLNNSGLVSNGTIAGVDNDKDIAILVPTDAAMVAAGLPVSTTTDSLEQVEIKNFLLNHILQKSRFPEAGNFKTYYVKEKNGHLNVYGEVTTDKTADGFEITDQTGSTAQVINTEGSCNFSIDKAGIYQVNKALKFK